MGDANMSDEGVNVINDDYRLPYSYGSVQKMSDVGYVGMLGSRMRDNGLP